VGISSPVMMALTVFDRAIDAMATRSATMAAMRSTVVR